MKWSAVKMEEQVAAELYLNVPVTRMVVSRKSFKGREKKKQKLSRFL